MAVPREWTAYLMLKGFVALNGASLTIAEVDRSAATIAVSLIPETLARTTFGRLEVGDRINLEVDSRTQVIVDTVREVLKDESLLEAIR
jgi:riboflavin synthase